jgi:hypothetical protein
MDYNEHLVRHVDRFGRSVKKGLPPGEAMQKLLSVLDCLEYQVEQGRCPVPVIRSLQAAMRTWIAAAGDRAGLDGELDRCVEAIVKDMRAESTADRDEAV